MSETLKLKRTSNGRKDFVVGQVIRIKHPEDGNIYEVKIVTISDEILEVEVIAQIVDIGQGKEMLVFGGSININAESSEIGNCSRYGQQEVKLIHKIVNNVESVVCEVEGKQYRTCEEGCPVWKNNECNWKSLEI